MNSYLYRGPQLQTRRIVLMKSYRDWMPEIIPNLAGSSKKDKKMFAVSPILHTIQETKTTVVFGHLSAYFKSLEE